MKPLNLIALLLFLGGAVWALTRSDRTVREIQNAYYSAMSPFLKSGSKMETQARAFLEETRHSKELEAELDATAQQFGRLRLIESRFRALEYENEQLRHALDFKNHPLRRGRRPGHPPQSHHLVANRGDRRRLQDAASAPSSPCSLTKVSSA